MSQDKDSSKAYFQQVLLKYTLYNGLFITLPFAGLKESGQTLPVFANYCHKQLKAGVSPDKIVTAFFRDVLKIEDKSHIQHLLILYLQFVERQVVLFDALEDAAFAKTRDLKGPGSYQYFIEQINEHKLQKKLQQVLLHYKTRIVLTAHPTQFYPPYVLDIITALTDALKQDALPTIRNILLQLGKTSLSAHKKPTPLDEADFLIKQMSTSFYPALLDSGQTNCLLGFWPGGDRDGNPNVTAQTVLEVAKRLKHQIIKLYRRDLYELKLKLTFPSIWEKLNQIDLRLKTTSHLIYNEEYTGAKPYQNCQQYHQELLSLKQQLLEHHNGLFVRFLQRSILAVEIFGFYFASLDFRENAPEHLQLIAKIYPQYKNLADKDKTDFIVKALAKKPKKCSADLLDAIKNIPVIQQQNGPEGIGRYIISNCKSSHQILEVFLLSHLAGLDCKMLPIDIVPLFESVEDLKNAPQIMEALLKSPLYKKHLNYRQKTQTVMLGFSDGTKDGGYLMANWQIFQCKMRLSELSKRVGVHLIFFDGRGGPPARGGGNTHLFYRAIEDVIPQYQVQVTIQGQTISAKFGTEESAQFNCEQLITAALSEKLMPKYEYHPSKKEFALFDQLAELSYQHYSQLKDHPLFTRYLSEVTPMDYYAKLNIASRPSRRKKSKAFSDLRAIPFVGAWTQMKQNVPGYYGLGFALKQLADQGHLPTLKKWYQQWLYFRTLINNAMMSLKKSNFLITKYLKEDNTFSEFWQMLFNEMTLSEQMCRDVSESKQLLETDPLVRQSIDEREKIVLPLLVIQQYALINLRTNKKLTKKQVQFFEKLLLKSISANINAARNAV